MGNYCEKHKSYDGYIDSNGKWHCWSCYKDDPYLNPKGEVIMTHTIKDIEARAVAESSHRISIEVWIHKPRSYQKVFYKSYDYLSVASREWDRLISNLECNPPIFNC